MTEPVVILGVFDDDYVRDISEKVFRTRLEQDAPGKVDRMLTKDADDGVKLRNRAGAYDPLTRAYLSVLGIVSVKFVEMAD